MESAEARPVLSFLFRTCQFVARGHARLARSRSRGAERSNRPPAPRSVIEGRRIVLSTMESSTRLKVRC